MGGCLGTKTRITAREIAMIGLTNLLTDMPNWHSGVFNDEVIELWRGMAMKNKLISDRAWEWCSEELRDKARLFSATGRVLAQDAGACVCKSDTIVPSTLQSDLKEAIQLFRNQIDKKDWHLYHQDQHVVNLVDPSLYPLVYGKTKVLLEGGKVGLNDFSRSYGRGITTEIPNVHPKGDNVAGSAARMRRDGYPFCMDEHLYLWSTNYQWLPCEVKFDGDLATSVRITSYINNLHPVQQKPLYGMVERLIGLVIEPWNDVLMKGEHGRVPIRIRTYGTVDDAEAEAARAAAAAAEVMGMDKSPSPVYPETPKHPEPGTAFSYEEWKAGKNGKSIIPQLVWEPDPYHAWRAKGVHKYIDVDHELYSISLQNTFKKKGLQIIVQIGSIELTPECPSFAGEDWHIDGTKSEHIAATAIYYYDVQNIQNMQVSFRQKTYMSESAYHLHNDEFLAQTFDIDKDLLRDDDLHSVPGTQKLGSIIIREGRLLAWSNALHYLVEPCTLHDPTRAGHARFIKLMLVDPHYRICSTLNVPPQRHDWWAEEVYN